MNILTFDIEEWYLEKVLHGGRDFRYQQFDKALENVLYELDRRGIKATFFCVGRMAIDFPQVVREIASHGHEVGCHSNEHAWLNKMTEKQMVNDTSDAIKALEDAAGQKVVSYRAPAFSITPDNLWAINVLADCGIENDASIFPISRDYGGYKGFLLDTPCVIRHGGASLREFPIGLTSFLGKKTAYSGGGYFRLLPYWFVNKTITRRDYNVCYFHLTDLIAEKVPFKSKSEYEDYFKESGTLKNRIIRYAKSNIGTGGAAFGKFVKLLSNHTFTCIRDIEIEWTKVRNIIL